ESGATARRWTVGPTGEATTQGDLRRLHRATEFTAALAATDLHWPDLAQAVVDHTSRLVGDGVGLFLFPEPAGSLALQAAGHHRASERRETWVDLAPLADLVAHLLSEADPTRPEPRLVDVDRDPLLRAG